MHPDFCLNSQTAIDLYQQVAKDAPIIDYHCHLTAKEIYDDQVFENITKLWLGHDHYKWRAMRYAGISEEFISQSKDDEATFVAYAKVLSRLIGSPLYHWSHMELANVFGVEEWLNEDNASRIYHHCNQIIKQKQLSPKKLIEHFNVEFIGTTDDPIDNLHYHQLLKEQAYKTKVKATFRPDKVFKFNQSWYLDYLSQLEQVSNVKITDYTSLKEALASRINYFDQVGCRFSDHSIEYLENCVIDSNQAAHLFDQVLQQQPLSHDQTHQIMMDLLVFLAGEYDKKDWIMQLHIGAHRNINSNKFRKLGVDVGYDMMNDFRIVEPLTAFLNTCEQKQALPKTIIYTLNNKDNLVLSTVVHAFSQPMVVGKIQFGAPWWFNDHKVGFLEHFTSLANQGILAYHVGMLTDSRSFLSYVRHDYYRRNLCDFVANLVDQKLFSDDQKLLKSLIEDISVNNIRQYIGGL